MQAVEIILKDRIIEPRNLIQPIASRDIESRANLRDEPIADSLLLPSP